MSSVIGVVTAVVALGCAAVAAGAGAPTLAGRIVVSATDAPYADDVMLIRADGTMLDLSNSPGPDLAPVLSPDGKRVAFYSTRAAHGAEYVVGTDGKGLRQVTPGLAAPPADVAWAPNGRDLAVLERATVYRASTAGRVWKAIGHGANGLGGWSPDGSRVAFSTTLDDVVAVSPAGKRLFRVNGMNGTNPLWSSTGRLAAEVTSTTWAVYSERGKRLATVAAAEAAWSADGRLATLDARGNLAIRPGGVGRPTIAARPIRGAGDVRWAGPTHLLVRGAGAAVLFDVVHRKTFLAPAAYGLRTALARDGSAFGEQGPSLLHATLSGSTRRLVTVAGCLGRDSDPFAWLQALPDGSGAVYQSTCVPPHDLYSLASDGSGLERLTSTPQDEVDPAVSPDGTRVAFSRDQQIWITAADGSDARSVTLPSGTEDDRPSFSPDGTKLVFARWEPAVTGDSSALAVAPTTGGAATLWKVPGGNPAWGQTGIAFDSTKGDVEVVRPDGSHATPVPGATLADGGIPAWSPDGRLAILRPAGRFSIYFPATRTTIPLPGLRSPIGEAPGLAWSPDGTRLAFTAADANVADDVWIVGADGSGLTRITHGLGADGALAWR